MDKPFGVVGVAPANTPTANQLVSELWDYWLDAGERSILFADVLYERSKLYKEHSAKVAPHVLKFSCELLIDGRQLERPVNYVLVRVNPPDGAVVDEKRRPFIVVDPRAGHGPGIGGFKPQSEIGVAFKAGHPCYFIGFLPVPEPGQTIEDIGRAQARFIEHVISLHPDADGKPVVIGNCQAGWAVMMLAATRPELFGPIIVAGSPLSYWAGVRGQSPLRYLGGLLGGTWLTALTGDLGAGIFDGTWLVSNFESLDPANTLWKKHYNLYSKIDSEAPRYLQFEQWWGGHVLLNAEEMQFIADQLFVGNKLSSGEVIWAGDTAIDLRNIRSPIVAFCSKADNITPPQQALHWILDLYDSVEDIRMHGQTIVYAIHDSVGHLGIFVSGSVAKKEHDEFASNIDLIDVLPPGLYEAVMTPKDAGGSTAELVGGDYLVKFEARTLDDIRRLGGNDVDDDRMFATAARLSEINLGLYRTFLQPWLRSSANDAWAEAWRRFHPLRLQYEAFGSANPLFNQISRIVEDVRNDRHPVSRDNVFWQAQEQIAESIETTLDSYRDARDRAAEILFHAIYGSPAVQAMVGLRGSEEAPRRRPLKDANYQALVRQRIDEHKRRVAEGGPREAVLRAMLYIRLPDGVFDERGFNLLRAMRDEAGGGLSLESFKRLVREQFFMLLTDEEQAVAAIPDMLSQDEALSSRMIRNLNRMIDTVGLESDEAKLRAGKIQSILEAAGKAPLDIAALQRADQKDFRSPRPRPARASKRA